MSRVVPFFCLLDKDLHRRTIHGGEPLRPTMNGRLACLLVLNLLCTTALALPFAAADTGNSGWRNVGVDPDSWTDGPDSEDTPMQFTYQGNAIVEIEVS